MKLMKKNDLFKFNLNQSRRDKFTGITVARFLLGLAAIGLASDICAQTVPLEPSAFTEYVATAVRREVGDTVVSARVPLHLSIGELDGQLDRILAYCRSNGAGCDGQVQQFAKAAGDIVREKNAPIDPTAVQLVVRSDAYVQRMQASLGTNAPQLQARPLVAGLMVVAILDTPRAIRPLTERDLKKLGKSQDDLFALAAINLTNSLQPLSESAKPVAAGQIGYTKPSFGEVGRVALPAQWTSLAQAQHGELIIALPTTDQVLYISESTDVARDALRALSRKLASHSSAALAPDTLLKWTAEGWETLK